MEIEASPDPTGDDIAALLRQAGITAPLTRLSAHAGGYSHRVYDLNDLYILRCSDRPDSAAQLAREAAALRRLAALPGTPRVLGQGPFGPRNRWQYLLLTKLPGENLFRLWIAADAAARERYTRELSALIRPIHRMDAARYSFGFYQRAEYFAGLSWHDGHMRHIARLLRDARSLSLDRTLAPLVDEAEAYIAAHHAALAYQVGPRFAHGDLHLYNVIAQDGTVTGIIDWEHANGSEPDFDLANLVRWSLYPAHPAEEALEADATRERFAPLIPALLDAYPEFAGTPRLRERMTIYELEHDLHQIIMTGAVAQPRERLLGWLREDMLDCLPP